MSYETESRIRELKAAWKAREAENDQILASAKTEDGILYIDNDRREAFQKNTTQMKEIKGLLADLEADAETKQWGNTPERDSVAVAHGANGDPGFAPQAKTIGGAFTESDEFKALVRSGGGHMSAPWNIEGVDIGSKWVGLGGERKDVYTTTPTGTIVGGFAPVMRDDMVMRSYRRARVRDLFPVQQTTAGIIEYFRVTGFVGNSSASVVPDRVGGAGGVFGLKPQTALSFVGVQAPVRTIAHWEAAHRNVLMDVPQLQGVIDNELLYGLRLREDDQILNGTGNGEDLLGILQTTGIQTYSRPGSPPANENKADDIRRAATKVILSYYEPTGVVMHPTDWEAVELLKDTTGAYIVAVAVALGGEQRIWRLPVVDTPAIAQGTSLVGAFGLGATLYDRMQASVRIAEQHSDFFLRNAIVVLCEERIALATKRPEAFVKVSLGS